MTHWTLTWTKMSVCHHEGIILQRLWVDSIPSVMDVSSLTSLPSYGLDVTVDMLTTSSDVKLNADNVHISFGSYARREMGER